jgi:uncharacterized protein YjbI with pentapeptide repeats
VALPDSPRSEPMTPPARTRRARLRIELVVPDGPLEALAYADVRVVGADLTEAQMLSSTFDTCDFVGTRFNCATLKNCVFADCRFAGCDFFDAVLTDCRMVGSTFDRCTFTASRSLAATEHRRPLRCRP